MIKGTLQIDILGTSFTIQAEEDSLYLEKLLAYYKRIIKQVEDGSSLTDPLKKSILAGIMLCDELQKEKKALRGSNSKIELLTEEELTEAERITLKMIEKLDQALN